jgi:hypothetical protein
MIVPSGDSAEENLSFKVCSASNRLDFFVTFFVKKKSKINHAAGAENRAIGFCLECILKIRVTSEGYHCNPSTLRQSSTGSDWQWGEHTLNFVNSDKNVQECDATDVDSSNQSWLHKTHTTKSMITIQTFCISLLSPPRHNLYYE